jgi:hypothetical protein
MSNLLFLDSVLDCSSEKTRSIARDYIAQVGGGYVKLLENEIRSINRQLGDTKRPGIADSATRLREKTREVIILFQSIKEKQFR